MAAGIQADMVRLTPLEELRAMFASDTPDYSRMRRLAIIVTLRMADRTAAEALYMDLEAAINLHENVPDDGRHAFAMIDLDDVSRLS